MNSRLDKVRIIEAAERYVRLGKLGEAIAEYQKLSEGEEQDTNISNIIGDLYMRLGQDDKALASFRNVATHYESRGLYSQALAIYKKINKLSPEDIDYALKLAELYGTQGFILEAKSEYIKIAEKLKREKKTKQLIFLYEKLIKIDRQDVQSRLMLASLYISEGLQDEAVDMLNEVAEFMIEKEENQEAEKILQQALEIKKNYHRTISNLVEILKKEGKKREAVGLIEESLKKDKSNVEFLALLGNLYFEDKDFKNAEEIFSQIIFERPLDVKARVKLGRIKISQDKLDEAYELFEPLVSSLIKKHKEEKAIGLLGLILASKKAHLPTLEKLASIYKSKNQPKNLEVTFRVILKEARERNLKEKMLYILSELTALCPEDELVSNEYKQLRKEYGLVPEARLEAEEAGALTDQDEQNIQEGLANAELHIEQGLIRNARRILDNLRLKYSDDPRILQKLVLLDELQSQVDDEEIPLRVEKVMAKQAQVEGREYKSARLKSFLEKEDEEDKILAAEIFAETDLLPLPPLEAGERKYYDLAPKINEELQMIETMFYQQVRGDKVSFEKELSEIVSEFKNAIDLSFRRDEYDVHYHLGVAFLEQGLLNEAIEEFEIAANDKSRAVECYNNLGYCCRQKKDFKEAIHWIEKGIELSEDGSNQLFALKYELACVYEELKEFDKALSLLREVQKWDSEYRDVPERLKKLEKLSATKPA
jgi:tetratricopeptide (TPR) repeat protein